jgi:hypothetical protein
MVKIGFCYSDDFYLNYSRKSNFKGFFGPNPKTFYFENVLFEFFV